ncbi:MAG: hypothetical protein FD163_1515 [Hyphomonadaceae bacterium]|nr:MAG: hypothetical protein FD163_1515 [Hyphomonadaceae bacterium]
MGLTRGGVAFVLAFGAAGVVRVFVLGAVLVVDCLAALVLVGLDALVLAPLELRVGVVDGLDLAELVAALVLLGRGVVLALGVAASSLARRQGLDSLLLFQPAHRAPRQQMARQKVKQAGSCLKRQFQL